MTINAHSMSLSMKPSKETSLTTDETPESPPPTTKPWGPPQDGPFAWLQVLMSHTIIFNTWGYINSYGVFQTYYVSHLGHSASDVSWVGSVQVFLLFFVGVFSGPAADAGHFRLVFSIGMAAQLVGIFMTSICSRYYQLFLAQGILTGIGQGLMFCPGLSILSTYHTKRKALAIGLSAAGVGTGGIVFPVIAQHLLPKIGFGWTIRVMGFVMLATLVFPLTFMRARLPPRKVQSIFEWKEFRDPVFVLYSIGVSLCFMAMYFAFYYIGTFGVDVLGQTENQSITLLLVLNGCGIPGRIIPNYVSDRWLGPINSMIVYSLVSALLLYVWIAVSSISGVLVFAVIYGLFSSGLLSLFPAVLMNLSPDLSKMGVRLGMLFICLSVACLTGPPIGGAMIQSQGGSYVGAQVFFGSLMALAMLFLIALRTLRVGWKLAVKV